MNNTLLLIFCGGGIGAVMRYLVGSGIAWYMPSSFPYGTLLVNTVGGLLIGMAAAYFAEHPQLGAWRYFIITGVLGGFTTFSAFGLETVQLLEKGAYSAAALYVIGSVVSVLLLVVAGGMLIRFM
jgi:CrcB protein